MTDAAGGSGDTWASEYRSGRRFAFGRNWKAFAPLVDEARIADAEHSLKEILGLQQLDGLSFLDAGSGSGLFSLAARRLGARVVSFDYDPDSVECTAELAKTFSPGDPSWRIEAGSVLDRDFLERLGTFDIVYSWGVLHHTGAMWQALDNVIARVGSGGSLYIAIYNDQGRASTVWRWVKRLYVRAPGPLKWVVLTPAFARLWGPTLLRDALRGRPLKSWNGYAAQPGGRGMHPWRDVVDWVGGYPFEVATPAALAGFCAERGLDLAASRTCGTGLGCNEFLFRRGTSGPGR